MARTVPVTADRVLQARFERDGYVHGDGDLLADVDSESIWEQFGSVFASGADRVHDGWVQSSAVRAIATHPAVLDVLRTLYGREPIPFQTLNYLNGSQQRTHSDTIHFSSFPQGLMCGVWVALEDVTLRQGPLHYYPGSHQLPYVDYDDLGLPVPAAPFDWKNPVTLSSYLRYEVHIERTLGEAALPRVDLEIPRGSYFVWAANLHHGGSPIADPSRTRKSQVTHYFFADSVPYTPMFSRRDLGTYLIRRVKDITSGRFSVPTLDGAPVLFEKVCGGLYRIHPVTSPIDHALWRGQAFVGRAIPMTLDSLAHQGPRKLLSALGGPVRP